MPAQDIIVIGGSAGGLEALSTMLGGLPRSLNAALVAVLHTSPQGGGVLPQVLERACTLPVKYPAEGESIQRGHVYVAPPDRHLTLESGTISVHSGPRENGFRPAIDPLFRSAAKQFGDRVVGVVLSGALDDGTFGLMAIKEAGGSAIVQHPYEAIVPSMPLSAIQNVEVDHIVRARDIPALLLEAAARGLRVSSATPKPVSDNQVDPTHRDISLAGTPPDAIEQPPSAYVCPECGGSLWEAAEGRLTRFRCHTGHGFTVETLFAAQNVKLENALWSAVRVLMERAALHRQLAARTAGRGMALSAEKYDERAHLEEQHASAIRDILSAPSLAIEPQPLVPEPIGMSP
jgi:two-component system, chemotaxis family, protein-glutamate methylesterase/glutaminase